MTAIVSIPSRASVGAALHAGSTAAAVGARPIAGAAVGVPPPLGDITSTAAVAIGGGLAACLLPSGQVALASCDDLDCVHCFGVTLGAAAAGAAIVVRRIGALVDPAFAFVVGPVFLGLNGALTQVQPVSGLRLQIGYATAPTSLFVHPRPAVILAAP